ncbi:interleukin-23 receptor [Indicator indicator]|uniref:interleukin-23 receptor n=1 Tax=Indicator indicator TaxID=1002788 RepID=UPI0023DFDA25|nr:interleukin-23 receptor [Indicator indicator]
MVGSREALELHILFCCLCGGLASLKCWGHVWVEPAPVVRMGSDVSINCLYTFGCPWAEFHLLFNASLAEGALQPLNSSAVQLRLRDYRTPFRTVFCVARCRGSHTRHLLCGTTILAGYPPDPPSNLSCTIQEGSEYLVCRWDTGRPTELLTNYSLHLHGMVVAEDAEEKDDEEEKAFTAGSPVPLSVLHGKTHYWAWVQASNALGAARSPPQHLNLQQLVVPSLPLVIGAETTETSPPTTTLHWRRQTLLEDVHCEERHRATGTLAWHQHRTHSWHNLQSNTQYVFQVRCRLSPTGSPWSSWSTSFLYTTPEAAPTKAPDTWRRLGPALPNGSQEVTVLVKPLPAPDARGRILGYAVTTKTTKGSLLLCNTSSTACTVLLPPGAHILHVTAHNSKGASSPATITLNQGTNSQEEFPAPLAVEVKPENQSIFLVTWQHPQHSRRSLLWFIVEWIFTTQYSQEEQYFWKKVPQQEAHTYIQEGAAAGGHINVSVYAVYPDGVSKPSSGQVPPGNHLLSTTYSEISYDDDIGVFLGLGISMLVLSLGFAVLMFKKSARKRIKASVVPLLPKWLREDLPQMENSNVVKSLQEKSDFMDNNEPFLDISDPTVTEVEEVPEHEEYKTITTRRKPSREVPKELEHPKSTAPASTTIPEQISDYKPQVSDVNPAGYIAANFYQAQTQAALPEPEMNVCFRDYPSTETPLWRAGGGDHNLWLLEKVNLVLNSSQSGQSHVFSSAVVGHGSLMESQWAQTLAMDAQEQTLVPEELLCCLRAINGGSGTAKSCFPQSTGGLF